MRKYSFKNNKMQSLMGIFTCLLIWTFASTANAQSRSELKCLALNIYWEARGESRLGQIGIAMVTVNRYRSGLYQNSICGVVWAYGQFSWTRDKIPNKPTEKQSWSYSLDLAQSILNGTEKDPTNLASHYYNPKKVKASWASKFTYLTTIGNHRFYRQPGFLKRFRNYKNYFDQTNEQDDYYHTELNQAPDEQDIWREQQIHTDRGDNAERFQQFLQYIDSLPDEGDNINLDEYFGNKQLDPRVIEL